jgi:putative Holliday junction resolvase
MRILAIDYGLKRTGLAISDELGLMAHPLKTVETSVLISELQKLHQDDPFTLVVLGLPFHMDGREGTLAPKIHQLKAILEDQLGIPVTLIDERLSSFGAERSMRAAGMKAKKRKAMVDQLAAVGILRKYLERSVASH